MTRDYAHRSRNPPRKKATKAKKATKTTRQKRAQPRKAENPGAFNAPSFSAGAIFGAALVLLASYAPTVFNETEKAVRQQVEVPTEKIVFEFAQMLEDDVVVADTSVYPAEFPEEDPNAPPVEYVIQAASLRASDAAAALSSDLTAEGLTASYERVDLSNGTWYRVMVGPFMTRVEANRALTRLRKKNLGARLIKLG